MVPDMAAVKPLASQPTGSKVGDPWIDRGAVCDGKQAGAAGCLFDDGQRLRLIIRIQERVITAATNYKMAVESLRVDQLMKDEDDLPWVLSLALDIAGAHMAVVVGKALKRMHAGAAASELTEAIGQPKGAEVPTTSGSTTSVNEKRIDTLVTKGFDVGKKQARTTATDTSNRDDASRKVKSLTFLELLKKGCDRAFFAFEQRIASEGTDVELSVVWQSLDPQQHEPALYKAALAEKLSRFLSSGVSEVGRKAVYDAGHDRTVARHTRVVLVRDIQGKETAWYQSEDGIHEQDTVLACDPRAEEFSRTLGATEAKCEFGPRTSHENRQIGKRVPDEFLELAIARSEEAWGVTQTIDHPMVTHLKSHGTTPAAVQPAPTPLPSSSVFQRPVADSWISDKSNGLPSNSVFSTTTTPSRIQSEPGSEPRFMMSGPSDDTVATMPGGAR